MIPDDALTAMICPKGHPYAWVVKEDGVYYVEIPRHLAQKQNRWRGTPLRTQLTRGSGHQAGCACGMWLIVMHQELEDGVATGRRRIIH